MNKLAAIKSSLLKNKVLPGLASFLGEYKNKHLNKLLAGAAGWTMASGLMDNLFGNKPLNVDKMSESFIDNLLSFGLFDMALLGGGKAIGKAKELFKKLKNPEFRKAVSQQLKQNVLSKDKIKSIIKSTSSKAKEHLKPTSYLPIATAAIGAMSEYDPEHKLTSVAKGSLKGGLFGKGLKAIPAIYKGKNEVIKSFLESAQFATGFKGIETAMENRQENLKKQKLRDFYRKLQSLQANRYYGQ